MRSNGVQFSIAAHAAWAPGLVKAADWAQWARAPYAIVAGGEPQQPALTQMPAMLRRRAGSFGKMALEVAYQCLDGRGDVPMVFCSRHGEVARAVELLSDLARGEALSPTGFGMAVHNASAGLFTIARAERANHIALAAGAATVEHAVIDACGLLADGAPMVLLVACDSALPPLFSEFEDCREQPHAWAWLMVPAADDAISLSWSAATPDAASENAAMPGGLDVLRFQLSGAGRLERHAERRRWRWSRDV
ncbi:beta-ketoacyl synthase chain length factor [Rugamonas sp. CCM 8940]|uniref:beta-ketoacyl synthase chain length factor n=1 Tax=Rugamonas sp. CCM 8940 TaxID=2765359 RepID=UPI0018F3DD76|nr:beta-ketoacyl synthase chain length factor [Rugamonas sp. CCM 8940]MBJ7314078.1 beta-ketoacyl synthase chain length factor [Rugamonas sp. CCM 8940]